MPYLIAYRKVIDSVTTHQVRLPQSEQMSQSGIELATLADGRTIVAVFSSADLPADQPAEIAESIQTLSAKQKADILAEIKSLSPHVALINSRVTEKIAQRYSITDEIKLLRAGTVDELASYNKFVEECRAWGTEQKAALGL